LALADLLGDALARSVAGVAGLLEARELDVVADVDAGQVHQLEGPHRISQRGPARRVDVLDRGDAVLVEADGLVADRAEDAVGDEAGDLLVEDHRGLPDPARELNSG